MKTTYLDRIENEEIVYQPVGTIEWHGHHLPLETDVIVAEKICEEASKEIPGFVMPGLWLATDREENDFVGMERHIGKKLLGEIYFLKPEFLKEILGALIQNFRDSGFKKIVIITGHAGRAQIGTLNEVAAENKDVIFVNPFENIEVEVVHADENETSVFWAARPEEEAASRGKEIPDDDDYFRFLGRDPRAGASLDLGRKLLNQMVKTAISKIKGEGNE